jgi:hypothetical protein
MSWVLFAIVLGDVDWLELPWAVAGGDVAGESWEGITVVESCGSPPRSWRLELMMSRASRPSLIFCLRSTVGKSRRFPWWSWPPAE